MGGSLGRMPVHALLVGLPGAGKATLMDRLFPGENPSVEQIFGVKVSRVSRGPVTVSSWSVGRDRTAERALWDRFQKATHLVWVVDSSAPREEIGSWEPPRPRLAPLVSSFALMAEALEHGEERWPLLVILNKQDLVFGSPTLGGVPSTSATAAAAAALAGVRSEGDLVERWCLHHLSRPFGVLALTALDDPLEPVFGWCLSSSALSADRRALRAARSHELPGFLGLTNARRRKTSSGPMLRGGALLTAACEVGNAEAVQLLLDNGLVIETRTAFDQTPLMCAAQAGHVGVTALLLRRGADAFATEEASAKTALDRACEFDQLDTASMLVNRMMNGEKGVAGRLGRGGLGRVSWLETAFACAVWHGSARVVGALLGTFPGLLEVVISLPPAFPGARGVVGGASAGSASWGPGPASEVALAFACQVNYCGLLRALLRAGAGTPATLSALLRSSLDGGAPMPNSSSLLATLASRDAERGDVVEILLQAGASIGTTVNLSSPLLSRHRAVLLLAYAGPEQMDLALSCVSQPHMHAVVRSGLEVAAEDVARLELQVKAAMRLGRYGATEAVENVVARLVASLSARSDVQSVVTEFEERVCSFCGDRASTFSCGSSSGSVTSSLSFHSAGGPPNGTTTHAPPADRKP